MSAPVPSAAARCAVSPGETPAAALDLDGLLAAVRAVAGGGRQGGGGGRPVALHEPWFGGREREYVLDCIDTGWVSSVGAYVDRFERAVAQACGVARAVATVNGTAALHVALLLAGVRPGDEVLIPTLTFVATANAVSYCGATPHFVDAEPESLGMDPDRLEAHLAAIVVPGPGGGAVNRVTGRRLAAMAPMHVFGHPARIGRLAAVAARFGIALVEDAAESLGSTQGGRPLGGRGLVGAVSFNGNKIVTTGGGGAVLTDDEGLADRAKHLTTTAKLPHRWAFDHDAVGFNYRLPNINAALGCAQLERLDEFVALKRTLAARYAAALAGVAGARFLAEPPDCRSNYWLNAVLLDDPADRDRALAALNDAGFAARPCWTPMHRLPMYAGCPRDGLAVAEDIAARLVNLPSSPALAA